jgi:hypothetical protein
MTRKLPLILTAAAVALVTTSTASLAAAGHPSAGFVDGVWIDGVVHGLSTGPAPAGAKHPIPLYVIAPISAAHPLHPLAFAKPLGFGAHDHVAAIPDPKAAYHGTCDLMLVVPGAKGRLGSNVEGRQTLTPTALKPLLYRARLDGVMTPLNSATRIKRARALGLAKVIDTRTVIACTITPRRQS